MTVTELLLTCTWLHTGLLAGPAGADEGPWRWPLAPVPTVIRAFEPPQRPWGPGHRGVDLAARQGQPVYAAGAGRVTYAARLAGRGVISITHGRLRTTYLPVKPSVRLGQRVRPGDRIGNVENRPGHCARRPCLHWGLVIRDLRRGPTYSDPLSLLGVARVRLLPVWNIPPPETGGGENQRAAQDERTSKPSAEPPFRPSLAGVLTASGGTAALSVLGLIALARSCVSGRTAERLGGSRAP
jgi:murein DD-endopeptidase MepM/ murein hydrolase activator NlpD